MTGSGRRSARSRVKSAADDAQSESLLNAKQSFKSRRDRSRDHSFIRILNADLKLLLGIGVVSLFVIWFLFRDLMNPVGDAQKKPRVVTPFPAPKIMDLPQVKLIICVCESNLSFFITIFLALSISLL